MHSRCAEIYADHGMLQNFIRGEARCCPGPCPSCQCARNVLYCPACCPMLSHAVRRVSCGILCCPMLSSDPVMCCPVCTLVVCPSCPVPPLDFMNDGSTRAWLQIPAHVPPYCVSSTSPLASSGFKQVHAHLYNDIL